LFRNLKFLNKSAENRGFPGLSEKARKTCSDSFFSAAFARVSEKPRSSETGANARAVKEVSNFLDSP
jgi:hypothetical protein